MKLCKNGLHNKDLLGGRCANGECRPCRLASRAAYRATHRDAITATQFAHRATPQGREALARALYHDWRKNIAQRLVSKPSQIAALEAELEGMLTNGT